MRNSSDLSCKFSKIGRQRVKDAQFERLILQVQQDRYSKGWEKERQIGDLRHIPPHTSRPVLGVRSARSLSPFSAHFHLTTTLRRVRRCILRTSERHDSRDRTERKTCLQQFKYDEKWGHEITTERRETKANETKQAGRDRKQSKSHVQRLNLGDAGPYTHTPGQEAPR